MAPPCTVAKKRDSRTITKSQTDILPLNIWDVRTDASFMDPGRIRMSRGKNTEA